MVGGGHRTHNLEAVTQVGDREIGREELVASPVILTRDRLMTVSTKEGPST